MSFYRHTSKHSSVWGFDLPEPPEWGEARFLVFGLIAGLVAVYCIGSFAA
jgi:hypothetical protein